MDAVVRQRLTALWQRIVFSGMDSRGGGRFPGLSLPTVIQTSRADHAVAHCRLGGDDSDVVAHCRLGGADSDAVAHCRLGGADSDAVALRAFSAGVTTTWRKSFQAATCPV